MLGRFAARFAALFRACEHDVAFVPVSPVVASLDSELDASGSEDSVVIDETGFKKTTTAPGSPRELSDSPPRAAVLRRAQACTLLG